MPEFALDIIPCLIRRHTCRWSNWNKKLMRWEILNQHTQYISVALFLSVAGKLKTKSQQKMAPTSHPPRCQVKDPKSTENGPNKWSTWLKLVMIVCVCVCVFSFGIIWFYTITLDRKKSSNQMNYSLAIIVAMDIHSTCAKILVMVLKNSCFMGKTQIQYALGKI